MIRISDNQYHLTGQYLTEILQSEGLEIPADALVTIVVRQRGGTAMTVELNRSDFVVRVSRDTSEEVVSVPFRRVDRHARVGCLLR